MTLMLRAEDRIDQAQRPRAATPSQSPPEPTLPRGWRVPGFTRPAPLSRADWLIRGFTLLTVRGAEGLSLAALCDCPGGSRQGFTACFQSIADFRSEMVALWESTAKSACGAGEPGVRHGILAQFLDLAGETARPADIVRCNPAAEPAQASGHYASEAPSAAVIERAIRDWARTDLTVAAALARVDRYRLMALRDLLLDAGLSPRRAEERAAVFYAAQIGFDMLDASAGIASASPMRALAHAILGARDPAARAGATDGAAA